MEIAIDEVVYFDVITRDPAVGVADADSAPVFDVFEEATDTPIISATSMTKRTSKTGDYRGTFTASTANGFEVGKWYSVVVSATVDGITDKTRAMHFRVVPAEEVAGYPKVDVQYFKGLQTALDKIIEHAKGVLVVDVAASGSSTTAVALHATTGINAGVPSATNNAYLNRMIVWTSGAMLGDAYQITGYNGTTKVLTVGTMNATPDPADTAVIV